MSTKFRAQAHKLNSIESSHEEAKTRLGAKTADMAYYRTLVENLERAIRDLRQVGTKTDQDLIRRLEALLADARNYASQGK